MKYWVLAGVAGLAAVLRLVVGLWLGATPFAASLSRFLLVNAKLLALLGALIALLQYSRGDYLRRAWTWLALGAFFLVEADLLGVVIGPALQEDTRWLSRGALVIAANVCKPIALLYFARALAVAGFDEIGSSTSRRLAMLAAAAFAAAIVGTSIWEDARVVAAGDLSSLALLASALGDLATFILLAPLLYTTYALRGGALGWPFALLAASGFAWLLYDGVDTFARLAGTRGLVIVSLQEASRLGANLLLFAAGMAQRWVLARSAPHATTRGAAPPVAA